MNKNHFQENWPQFRRKAKEKWNKLTEEDLNRVNGNREHLLGRLQERYSWDTRRSEEELSSFERSSYSKNSERSSDYEEDAGQEQKNRWEEEGTSERKNSRESRDYETETRKREGNENLDYEEGNTREQKHQKGRSEYGQEYFRGEEGPTDEDQPRRKAK